MKNNENPQRLNIPGITPVIIDGKNAIAVEAMAKRFVKNNYVQALYDICWYWGAESYFILDALVVNGIIKQDTDYSMKWTLTKTSLAWLFKNIKLQAEYEDRDCQKFFHIRGGFWNPIAVLFGENKETLKKLICNKNAYAIKHNGKETKSEDIEKLKTILKENGIQL
jgi:hypothetical protein